METSIFDCIEDNKLDNVKLLISAGVNVNVVNTIGKTPLFLALLKGKTEIAKLLVEHGADVNSENDGKSILYLAAKYGNLEIVKTLIEHGACIDHCGDHKTPVFETALGTASENGKIEIVKLLLEHGADVNRTNVFNDSALFLAASRGHINVVKLLIGHGADIHAASIRGQGIVRGRYNSCHTALSAAYYNNYAEICKLLVDKGARFDITTTDGLLGHF